ncbi:MAG: LacI family DNA-binding transcriptional regulator [Actinomycetaceae bacterium]|nr:LacI family DNA-binding transcriptional regulator [Actinomycetaceae bacterium]
MARIRLEDIAAHSGVSIATVSRVLNKPEMVSLNTRNQVLHSIDTLGHPHPNRFNESSRPRMGIIVAQLTNPIFAHFASSFASIASAHGLIPHITCEYPGSGHEAALVESMAHPPYQGVVFVSGHHSDSTSELQIYKKLQQRRFPFVVVNGPLKGVPSFTTDDKAGINLAITHLAQLGHKRIGLINGDEKYYPAAIKKREFLSACSKYKMKEYQVFSTLYSAEAGGQAALEAVKQGMTGLIFASDLMAVGALSSLRDAGFNIPEDVSIIGYDGWDITSELNPPLTTIQQSVDSICEQAFKTLVSLINGDTLLTHSLMFSPLLVTRSSTGVAPQRL